MESIQELTAKLAARLHQLSEQMPFDKKMEVAKDQGISQASFYRLCSGDVKKIEKKLTIAEQLAAALELKLSTKTETADA